MGITYPSFSSRPLQNRGGHHRIGRGIIVCLISATTLLTAAPPQFPPPSQSLEALIAEGETAISAGNAKLALSRFETALPLAESVGDELLVGRALAGLGWAQWAAGQYDTPERWAMAEEFLFRRTEESR